MVRLVALLACALVLASTLFAATAPEQVAKWPEGKRMQAVLIDGSKTTGRLGRVTADGFVLNPDKKGGASRELRFSEVRTVSSKWTTGEKWLLAGLVYAGLCVIGVVLGN